MHVTLNFFLCKHCLKTSKDKLKVIDKMNKFIKATKAIQARNVTAFILNYFIEAILI